MGFDLNSPTPRDFENRFPTPWTPSMGTPWGLHRLMGWGSNTTAACHMPLGLISLPFSMDQDCTLDPQMILLGPLLQSLKLFGSAKWPSHLEVKMTAGVSTPFCVKKVSWLKNLSKFWWSQRLDDTLKFIFYKLFGKYATRWSKIISNTYYKISTYFYA